MSLKVAILGLGVSGVFAAKAAKDFGAEVTAFSQDKKPSFPAGPFWLHWVPDDIAAIITAHKISVCGVGNAKNYSTLQWGRYVEATSFPEQDIEIAGFAPSEALPLMLPENIVEIMRKMTDEDVKDIAYCSGFDVIIQTFPSEVSTANQPKLIPYHIASLKEPEFHDNYVVYNGSGKGLTVRNVHLWGTTYLEFPKMCPKDRLCRKENMSGFTFHLLHDMDPRTIPWNITESRFPNVHLVGRWAEWNNKRLSHEAYGITKKILEER